MSGSGKSERAVSEPGGRDTVVRSDSDGLITLTISRPPANTLDNATIHSLKSHLEEVGNEVCRARGVIITGSGSRFFSAGGDVKELDGMTMEEGIARIGDFHGLLVLLERLPVPVACAVNGDAVGGGTEICLFADYRIGVANARFGLPEVNHGLLPAARSIQQAVKVLGLREARRLLFEGLLIGAEEALRIGLIDAVARDREELALLTGRWGTEVARKPLLLLSSLKRTLALAGRLTEEEQYELMIGDFRRYFDDEEVRSRMRDLIERWKHPRNGRHG